MFSYLHSYLKVVIQVATNVLSWKKLRASTSSKLLSSSQFPETEEISNQEGQVINRILASKVAALLNLVYIAQQEPHTTANFTFAEQVLIIEFNTIIRNKNLNWIRSVRKMLRSVGLTKIY